MEHNVYGTQATFWRDAYLAAMQAGHQDPAAAADEAFLDFDCRFIEPAICGAALVGAQDLIGNVVNPPEGELHRWTRPTPPTADERVLQANKTETTVPSVVVSDPPVQDPSTEGLPTFEWKADDEVLG